MHKMSPYPPACMRLLTLGLVAAGALLSGCSSIRSASASAVEKITPYHVEVVQGNFVSSEQVAALKPGMPRDQVRSILGTPLLADIFHGDRWDYVFTIRRQGVEPIQRKLTVYFKDDVLDHVVADEMPSEQEFVQRIDTHAKDKPKIPPLEATPEQLEKAVKANEERLAAARERAQTTTASTADSSATPAASYPPLDATPN